MTKLDKPLTRLTEIKDDQGRELTVTMQPSGEGGEILLHWNGDKKKAGDKTFPLKDLSRPDQPRPSGWGTWIKAEDLKSQVNISPGLEDVDKTNLCLLIDRITLTREWLEKEDGEEWHDFLERKGRHDVMNIPCNQERSDIIENRRRQEAMNSRKNPHKPESK